MNNLAQAIWVETLKARRSKMPLLTALGSLLFPLALGFFMLVLKDPELARRYWLVSAKAQIVVGRAADWPTHLRLLALTSAMGDFLIFGLIASWVFGREYSDRTVKDLLALPTSRSATVLAKFVVVACWSAALTALSCLVGLGVGAAVGLAQASMPVILQGGVTVAIAACLTIALVTPIAFFASAGHGYLPPMGVALLILFLVQVFGQAGWGEYFAWAVPGLYAQGESLGAISYVIVILTSVAGVAGTLSWWELADQTR
jgi:ABC-2 type transport system permease protein